MENYTSQKECKTCDLIKTRATYNAPILIFQKYVPSQVNDIT